MATITVKFTSKGKDSVIDPVAAAKVFKGLKTVFDYSKTAQDKEIRNKLLDMVKSKDKTLGTAIFNAGYKVEGFGPEGKRSGEYDLKFSVDGKDVATSKCWINKESTTGAKNELFKDTKGKSISKEGYFGGGANAPHVHVYAGGCHLKLGSKRFNLVQDNKKYSSGVDGAHSALMNHALKDELAPWVAAALKYFHVSA